MKKQGSGKKGLAGILIAAGALILAAAVVLGIMFLGGKQDTPASSTDDKIVLYWNVERAQYVGMGLDGASGRMARSDGYYYVRFAVGGEQVDYQVADYDLIQKIDQLDVMGLEFDEQGVVIGVKNVNECTGGLVASVLYVSAVDGNTLTCNTQGTYKGINVTVELSEDTEVYDVGQTGLLCGIQTVVAEDDEIYAIKDYDGKIIYVFKKAYTEPGDVYWNITRKYNSASKTSTRELDELGCYVFDMAFNGEVIQVKTRDYEIATKIDAKAARCTGLEFDENGYVSAVTNASKQAGGTTFASWANVFEVKDGQVYAKKLTGSLTGTEYFGTLSKNCKIINVSGVGGEMGSYTELQYGDQIHGLTDNRGRVCYIWVISRLAGSDGWQLYWNVERKYNSTDKVTKRTPAADGYYYIDVATGGQQLTVKTKDKELVTKLDSYAARCFSMKINENNEIVKIGGASQIHGGSTFGSWYYVDKIDGKKLTVSRILTGDTEPTIMEGVMAEDVEIINGSTNFTSHCGEYADLKVGDRVHCLKDLEGNIRVIFIVEKSVPGPLYWNVTKKSVKNDMTTRERAADGYFYFTMAGGGKQYTFKTKDAEIATKIDSMAARCMGLTVTKSGIITKVHGSGAVEGCQGGTKSLSWVDVLRISGRTFVAQKDPKANVDTAGQIFTSKMASNCKVYNVSSNFNSFCGEETTLRVGDRVHVLHNREGDATVVFVVERQKQLDEKNTCPCNADVKWEPWDGTTALENNKYYYLTKDVTAPAEGFVLEGISVSLRLDGHTISSDGRCFFVKSGSKLNICDHETRGKLIGSGVTDESGGVIRVYSTSATVNLWNIDIARKDSDVMAKEGGLISCSGTVSLYDCNLSGGEASVKGGNVQISSGGTFRMFGGTVTGGTAPSGSSMNVTGRTYLEDVTVTGGSGNTMVFNTDKDMVLNGVTVDKASAVKGTVTLMGGMQIGSLTLSEDAVLADGGIDPGSKITLTAKPANSQVVMTGASEVAYKALTSFDPVDYVLSYNAGKKTVTVTCTIEPKTHTKNHCVCAGNASGLGEHTCTELTGWTEITDAVFENAVGIDGSTVGIKFKQDGNYYLSLDYNASKNICIMPGQNITICLNGCEISRGSAKVFLVAGTLNITDCSGQGAVSGGDNYNGGAVKLVSQGKLNLFGGTLTATGNCAQGGGVVVISTDSGNIVDTTNTAKVGSVFNMYGGTVTGGTASEGGNIALWHNTFFNMYGGTVSGGTASQNGGNLYMGGGAASAVQLLGGTITGGSTEGKGADVYYGGGSLTIGGSVKIGELYVCSDRRMTVNALTADSSVGIEMAKPGVFAESVSAYTDGSFTSLDDTYEVVYTGGKLKLDLSASAEGHIHCVCGGTANGLHTHECTNLIYEDWSQTDSLPTASGNYCLTEDVHLTSTEGHKIGGNSINLCLNGHKITGEGRLIWVNSGSGTLNICDHAGNSGSLEAPGVADNNAGGLIRHGTGGAHVGLYNITLRRTDEDSSRVLVKEGGVMSCSGHLDMYNVTMENGYAKKAGNLLIALTAKVNIVGCTFRDGTATADIGGNISTGGTKASDPVTVTIIDTAITGGSSKGGGDGIILGQNNVVMTLGGKITITGNDGQNLYIEGSDDLSLDGLSAESRIGVTMKTAGVIAESADDLSDCFISDNADLDTFYDGDAQEIYLAEEERDDSAETTEPEETEPSETERVHTDHCVCGGNAVGVGDHTCQTLTWTPLSQALEEVGLTMSTANFGKLPSGSYYLDDHVTVTAITPFGADNTTGSYGTKDVNINLCLNGFDISTNASCAFGRIYDTAVLSITDCTGEQDSDGNWSWDGTVYGGTNTNGSLIYTYEKATLNIYGGNFTRKPEKTTTGCGLFVIAMDKGAGTNTAANAAVMNLYNGNIYDGSSGKSGSIHVMHASTLNMYGGTVTGSKVSGDGGNIIVDKAATMNLYGGTVSNGTADGKGDNILLNGKLNAFGGSITGGDVYVANTDCVTLGGDVQIGQLTLADGVAVKLSEEKTLTGDAAIGISMVNAEKPFATVTDESVKSFFFNAENESYSILYNAEDKGLYLADGHIHCVCEGAEAKPEDHQCENITWVPLTQAMFDDATDSSSPVKLTSDGYVLDNGGHYCLSQDITIKETLTPGEGNGFSLCLNGKTLKGDGERTLFFKGTLNLTDCDYIDETVEEETVRVYGGSVISNRLTNTGSHAAVAYPRAGGVLNLYGGNLTDSTADTAKTGAIVYVSGEMNMYGGRISGGNSSGNGGNVNICDGATMHVYGGRITEGNAGSGKSGGNVYITNGSLYIHGGVIADGTSGGNGGNICIPSKGQCFIYGGQILDGQAGSGKNGGNIRLEGGSLEMTGGTISGGRANEGGNIAISGSGTMRMKGGTVEKGIANSSGGNFVVFGRLSVEESALIKDGIANGTDSKFNGGGNIFGIPNSTDIQITGGRIENGRSEFNGANIFLRSQSNKTAKLNITGGFIGGIHSESGADVHSVYLFKNNGTILTTVGGDAQVDDICFSDEKMLDLADTALKEEASIGVSLKNGNGTVIETLDTTAQIAYTNIIKAAQAGKKTAISGEALVIEDE